MTACCLFGAHQPGPVSPLKFPSMMDPHRRTQVPRHAHVHGLLSLIQRVGASGAFSTYCSFSPTHSLSSSFGSSLRIACFHNGPSLPGILVQPPPACTRKVSWCRSPPISSYFRHSASVHMLSLVSSVLRFLRSACSCSSRCWSPPISSYFRHSASVHILLLPSAAPSWLYQEGFMVSVTTHQQLLPAFSLRTHAFAA